MAREPRLARSVISAGLKLARTWRGSAQEDRKNKKTPKDKKDRYARVSLKSRCCRSVRPGEEGKEGDVVRDSCHHTSPELTPQDKKGKDGKEQAEQAELLSYDCSGRCASGERLHIGVGLSLSSEDMLPVTGVAKLPSLQESTDVPAAAAGAVTAAGSSKEG